MSLNNHIEHISFSKEESNAIKGLLILLVVLGHNSILSQEWNGSETVDSLFHWRLLYTFHVYCFFILPFLYNKHPYKKGNFQKYAIRLLYPYLWVCLLCLSLSLFIGKNLADGWMNLLHAVVSGSDKLLEENLGFTFPWFLPAMFALLLLKDIYYLAGKYLKRGLVCVGISLWTVVLLFGVKFSELSSYVPFALIPAFRLLPICLFTVWLTSKINFNSKSQWRLVATFTLLSILFWCFQTYDIYTGRMIFYFVMPVVAILLIFSFKDYLSKSRLLIALGKMSLQIYLYHIIVYNILLIAVKHFHSSPTFTDGVILLVVTLAFSYMGAYITTKESLAQKLLYPRSRE